MKCRLHGILKLKYSPIAIIFSNEKPAKALEFKEGKWGCVIAMSTAAIKGRIAVLSRETCGCLGGKVGLCFGNAYVDFPGGIDYFLSTGRGEEFREGEAYIKTPELARQKVDSMPITEIPFDYVIFKPLAEVAPEKEEVQLVCFYANPDQISALAVLVNYRRPGLNNVATPFGAGCHSICMLPYHEARQENPRAVLGMFDISARPRVPAEILSFTVPFKMFQEMEEDIPGSFLEKEAWKIVRARIKD
ncbi:conserved hypothetical protein [Candidatus Zixiibacteriota bacterium]|nr:conserved hypothetical protein [candidate division Zixibacteria bacterium]